MRLRARWVIPVAGDPIWDGEVVVDGHHIAEVRPRPANGVPVSDALDLGEAVIVPGLVNAHTHLEYTFLRGAAEDLPLFAWLDRLMELKARLMPEDYLASAMQGAAEAALSGVTTIADCTDSGMSAQALARIGLRGISYQEVFGIEATPDVEHTLDTLQQKLQVMKQHAAGSSVRPGIAPHSIYTVRAELLRALVRYADVQGLPLCIHAAESQPEAELALMGTGVRAERLQDRGIQWTPPQCGVLEYLDGLGALRRGTLLAHCVQLTSADFRVLARSGASVVYCPKSNAKLGNGVAPLSSMVRRTADRHSPAPYLGARCGIGTDSAVSSNNTDLLEELRFGLLVQRACRRTADRPTAADMFALATLGGARAVGLETEIGTLEVGKAADIAAFALDGHFVAPCHDPVAALVHAASARDCVLTMVGGRIVARSGRVLTTPMAWIRERRQTLVERLRRKDR